MYRQVVRMGAALLGGVALAIGVAQLGVGAGVQAGEAVPDHLAAALRGGDCYKQSKTQCVDGVNPDQFGRDCTAKDVYDYDKNADPYEFGTTIAYCGGTKIRCGSYFSDVGAKCSTTATAITATAGGVAP